MADEPAGIGVMRNWIESSPFGNHVGIELVSAEEDRCEMRLRFAPHLPTMGDVVHGGAIATLADMAAASAAWSTDRLPENVRGSTVSLTINFMAAARSADLTARAQVVRRGSSLSFIDVEVTDSTGAAVARAMATYKMG